MFAEMFYHFPVVIKLLCESITETARIGPSRLKVDYKQHHEGNGPIDLQLSI